MCCKKQVQYLVLPFLNSNNISNFHKNNLKKESQLKLIIGMENIKFVYNIPKQYFFIYFKILFLKCFLNRNIDLD